MFSSLRDHIYRIRYQILKDHLNRGRKWYYLRRYLCWIAFGKHGHRNWTITFENGMRSLVHPYPDHDAGELNIWTRNVDWYDTQLVRRVLAPGDIIVDAGCNVGNRTWALADIIGGALMLDANSVAMDRVQENLELNMLDPLLYHSVCMAVGAEQGAIRFSDIGGAHTLNHLVEANDRTTMLATVEVPRTTIDDEVARLNLRPTYIKVDLEGQDLNALKGARKTLLSGYVRLVKFEHNPSEPLQPLLEFFNELQWKVSALVNGVITSHPESMAKASNLFATPPHVFSELQRHGPIRLPQVPSRK